MIRLYGGNVFLQPCHERNRMHEPGTTRVGGFIPWEFCRWRLGATRKAKSRFTNPCYCPKTECLITSVAWPWRVLHLDNFDTLFAKRSEERRVGKECRS